MTLRTFTAIGRIGAAVTSGVLLSTLAGVPAQAAPAGSLTVKTATGILSTSVNVTTSAGCPVGSSQFGVDVVGGPDAWIGTQVVSIGSAGLSTSKPFDIPLDSLTNIAAANSLVVAVGKYTFRATCYDANYASTGTFDGSLWVTATGAPGAWQSADPATSVVTTTTALSVAPDGRVDKGSAVTLTASITPANAVGTVTFTDTISNSTSTLASGVTISAGKATFTTSTLPVGMHSFSATFVPTDATKFKPSDSPEVVFVVALPQPPTNVTPVAITGTAKPGSTLSCAAGSWTGQTGLAFAWLVGGKQVGSAETFKVRDEDALKSITCRVTATNAGGSTSRTASVTAALAGSLRAVAAPTITGTPKVGKVLTAKATFTPLPKSVSFIWLRNGVKVGAGATYKAVAADKGKKLTVKATATRVGYASATAISKAVTVS